MAAVSKFSAQIFQTYFNEFFRIFIHDFYGYLVSFQEKDLIQLSKIYMLNLAKMKFYNSKRSDDSLLQQILAGQL